MKHKFTKLLLLGVVAFLTLPAFSLRAADMQERIQTAIQILDQKERSVDPIPRTLMNKTKGVAIFTLTKAGIGVGGQGGEGIVVVRLGNGKLPGWSAPSAFNLGGATLGAQLGFSEARYIVLLNTDDAVRHFTTPGKFQWDAGASGTAGPDSGTEKVSTSDLERRDIVVYKDSGGLYGGATFGGSVIESKDEINQKAYGENVHMKDILNGTIPAPKSTNRLYLLLDGKS